MEELNPAAAPRPQSAVSSRCFNCSDFPESRPGPAGLDVESLPGAGEPARFDLEMHLWTQPDAGLRGSVVYSTDLFEAATIERLLGHFETLLAGIVADPDQRVVELPLLSDGGASAVAGGVERHGPRLSARPVRASVVRGAGGRGRPTRWRSCSRTSS